MMVFFDEYHALSVDDCARICHKSRQTVQRWEKNGWPKADFELCRLHALGRILPDWRYIRVNNGELVSDLDRWSENDLLNLTGSRVMIDDLQRSLTARGREIQRLQRQVNELEREIAASASNDPFRLA